MALERLEFFVGSTSTLALRNLRRFDVTPPTQVVDAVVTFRMLDELGDAVSGVTDPTSMAAVSGFDGFYQGTIPSAASVVLGDTGEFVITAISPTAGTRIFYIPYEVKKG